LLALVKEPVTEVKAVGIPVLTNKVDIAHARLEFVGGAVANVTASRVFHGARAQNEGFFSNTSTFRWTTRGGMRCESA